MSATAIPLRITEGESVEGQVMEERIVELELRSMAQQRTIDELSEVLYGQQKELDALKALVERLSSKVEEPGIVDAKQVEKPPHY
jgi:SlyX protein